MEFARLQDGRRKQNARRIKAKVRSFSVTAPFFSGLSAQNANKKQ
jgi:hypothetical protein